MIRVEEVSDHVDVDPGDRVWVPNAALLSTNGTAHVPRAESTGRSPARSTTVHKRR